MNETVWCNVKWDFWSSAFHQAFFICEALISGFCWVDSSQKNVKCRLLCPSHLTIVPYSWEIYNCSIRVTIKVWFSSLIVAHLLMFMIRIWRHITLLPFWKLHFFSSPFCCSINAAQYHKAKLSWELLAWESQACFLLL